MPSRSAEDALTGWVPPLSGTYQLESAFPGGGRLLSRGLCILLACENRALGRLGGWGGVGVGAGQGGVGAVFSGDHGELVRNVFLVTR